MFLLPFDPKAFRKEVRSKAHLPQRPSPGATILKAVLSTVKALATGNPS
jgi:hypothetical protein